MKWKQLYLGNKLRFCFEESWTLQIAPGSSKCTTFAAPNILSALKSYFFKFFPSTSFLFQTLQSSSFHFCYPNLIKNSWPFIGKKNLIDFILTNWLSLEQAAWCLVPLAPKLPFRIESDVHHGSFMVISASIASMYKWAIFNFFKNHIAQSGNQVNWKIRMGNVSIVSWERRIKLSNSIPQQPLWMSVDQGM